MPGMGELFGQPLISAGLNLATSLIQSALAGGRRPAPFQPSTTRNQGASTSAGNVRVPASQTDIQRFAGGGGQFFRNGSLPNPNQVTLGDVAGANLQDQFNQANRGRVRDQRLQGVIDDYRTTLTDAGGRMDDAIGGVQDATREGRQGYARARGDVRNAMAGIDNAEADTKQLAVENIRSTTALIQEFKATARNLMDNVTSMRGEVLANAKAQTGVLLADASTSVKNTTMQSMSDTIAEMRAMGVPEAQIQNQVAQMSADGQEQIGDMLREIGASENARLSQLEVDTGNWVSNLSNTTLNASAGVTSTAISEVGKTLGDTADRVVNLADVRARTAQISGALEDSAANFLGSQARMVGDLEALRSQMILGGNIDLANLMAGLEDPLVSLGPLAEMMFSVSMGLEEAEYNYALQNYSIQNAEEGMVFNSVYDSLAYFRQYADARHAQRYNQRNFNRSLGFAWIPTASGAASGVAGVLDEPTTPTGSGAPTSFGSLGEGGGQSYYSAYNPY